MYNFLVHVHSGFRWIVLAMLVLAIIYAVKQFKVKTSNAPDKRFALYAMIATHIQVLLGVILYFISDRVHFSDQTMSNQAIRFFTVEHALMMIIAVILITIGYSRAKRKTEVSKRNRTIFWFYLIALILILAMIPWPFQSYGTNWF